MLILKLEANNLRIIVIFLFSFQMRARNFEKVEKVSLVKRKIINGFFSRPEMGLTTTKKTNEEETISFTFN